MFGSVANSLAEDDDPSLIDGVQSPSVHSYPSRALEQKQMDSDSESGVAMLRRQCLAQREIVNEARAELLQALDKMDQRLAALSLDATESLQSQQGTGGTKSSGRSAFNAPP